MDSGFHGPKVAAFQVSNASFVLCFPNEMTSITGLLLKDNFSFFFIRKVARFLRNIISIIYTASRVIKYTSLP